MPNPLSRIERVAAAQLQRLEQAFSGTEIDRANVTANALEFLLRAIGNETALGERVAALYRSMEPVRAHLIELGEGWRCQGCQQAVVGAAQISGATSGSPSVELICRNCGISTAIAPIGMHAFTRFFGHLVNHTWNPRANGFGWDGT